jgi:PAS domain S-box-containing protein
MSNNLFYSQSRQSGANHPSRLFRYGIAVLDIICATLVINYFPVIGEWGRGALLLYFFATIMVTLWLGLYPGILSLILSLIGINLFLLIPIWHSAPYDALFLNTGFCFLSSIIIILIQYYHRQNQFVLESQQDLSLAQAVAQVGSWRFKVKGDVLYWTDEKYRIFEIALGSKVTIDTFFSAIHPEDREYVGRMWQACLDGEPYDIEHRIIVAGDKIKWIREKAILEFAKDGALLGGFGTTQDITDRKIAEQALSERENELRLIINSMPALIAYVDTDFRYVRVNNAYQQWLGIPVENIIGQEIKTILGEIAWQVIRPYLERALSGEQVRYELEMPYKTTNSRWIHANYVPDKDNDGHVKGVVGLIVDIGEIKQTEFKIATLNQTLQEHIEEMEALLNTAPIGLCISTDLSANVIRGNPAIEQMLALPANSELSLGSIFPPPIRVLVNGSEPATNELPMQRAVRGEKVLNQTLDIQLPDGKTITVLSNAVPLFNQEGDVRGAIGAFLDITALKNAESAALTSEERLRLAKKSGNLGVFDQNLISGTMHWDKRLRELWGIKPDEPLATEVCMASVHPDDRADVYAAVKRSFNPEQGGSYQAEYRIIRKTDGKVFWLAAFGTTTFENGRPVRLVGFVQDISDRKLAEKTLLETQARLALAAKELDAGYWDWNLETQEVYLSPEWKRQLGYLDSEVTNQFEEWENRLHPEDKPGALAMIDRYLNGLLPSFELEFRLRHKDGSYRWIHSRAALVQEQNQHNRRLIGIHLDITDYRYAKELNQQRDKMEEAFRLNIASQTVAAIAHELNQPLIAISYFADAAMDMLQTGNKDPEKLVDILNNCSSQAQRAGQAIKQLMSVIEKGDIQSEPVDINKMIYFAYNYIKANNELNSFCFEMNLATGSPTVSANTLQIQKILINIFHNSLEAMLETGNNTGTVSVTTRLYPDNPTLVQITVCDTGIGVPDASELSKMFKPFHSTKEAGLGMGLAISRALIEAHGGKMWAEQNADIGISIHFTLPLAP